MPATINVARQPVARCGTGGLDRVTTFGARVARASDGSVGAAAPDAADPQALFVSFKTDGRFVVCVAGADAKIRVRIDGRIARAYRENGSANLSAAVQGVHTIGLELGPRARLHAVGPHASPDPLPASAPLVIFLGDSYTEGAAGNTPPGYAYRAGWAKGWNVRIDALSSTGFLNRAHKLTYAERLPAVLAQHPKIVVVAGGINDYGNYTNAQITHAANAIFARITAAGARLIVLSPWEPPHFDVPSYHALVASIGVAARAHGARYIDTSAWLSPALMASDGIHPNERGYRTIAAKLALRL